MTDPSPAARHIHEVTHFEELVSTPFQGSMNAICWTRQLAGDFSEIVEKVASEENITVIEPTALLELQLSTQGQLARDILLNDLKLLQAHGASPTLNVIQYYDRDDSFFPTDVYSFHVDRSPVPTDTFLCTYFGAPSDILPNAQARQKVLIPELRAELQQIYGGPDAGFESFLSDYFFDLHYEAAPEASPVSLGVGNLWRLAVDHPGSPVPPCVHRAPQENPGQKRLLLIC
jgi:hypothetical protein